MVLNQYSYIYYNTTLPIFILPHLAASPLGMNPEIIIRFPSEK